MKVRFKVLLKTAEVLIAIRMTSLEAIRDVITRRHHPPIPAPSLVESHQAKQLHLKTTI
jgi:hypothetical protein